MSSSSPNKIIDKRIYLCRFPKRKLIAYYLSQGRSYENIKTNLAVSSTTIASVSEQMKKKAFQLALKHIEAEEWAKNLTEKIGKIVKFSHK